METDLMSLERARPRLTIAKLLFLPVLIAYLAGCSVAQTKRNQELDALVSSGDYAGAAMLAESRMGVEAHKETGAPGEIEFKPRHVLNHLDAAEAWRMAGNLDRALVHYEAAERALAEVETEAVGVQAVRQVGAVLSNDLAISYLPSPAESVLMNYYKALAYWQIGDLDNVRVELNRADDRTRRSVERYSREIDEAATGAEKEAAAKHQSALERAIGSNFPELDQWESYESFVLPPATYLQAIFLGNSTDSSDIEKSRTLMQRVVGITGNAVAEREYEELMHGSLCPTNDCVWVVGEHGRGPHLVERRFDLPIATDRGLLVVSMALPALETRSVSETPSFRVLYGESEEPMLGLACMNRVIQTEFKKRFPAIATRAFASSTVKAIAQNEVNKNAGPLAGLLVNIVATGTTAADTRMWRAAPGHFTIARIQRDSGQTIIVRHFNGEDAVELPSEGSALIYIKQPDPNVRPVIGVMSFSPHGRMPVASLHTDTN